MQESPRSSLARALQSFPPSSRWALHVPASLRAVLNGRAAAVVVVAGCMSSLIAALDKLLRTRGTFELDDINSAEVLTVIVLLGLLSVPLVYAVGMIIDHYHSQNHTLSQSQQLQIQQQNHSNSNHNLSHSHHHAQYTESTNSATDSSKQSNESSEGVTSSAAEQPPVVKRKKPKLKVNANKPALQPSASATQLPSQSQTQSPSQPLNGSIVASQSLTQLHLKSKPSVNNNHPKSQQSSPAARPRLVTRTQSCDEPQPRYSHTHTNNDRAHQSNEYKESEAKHVRQQSQSAASSPSHQPQSKRQSLLKSKTQVIDSDESDTMLSRAHRKKMRDLERRQRELLKASNGGSTSTINGKVIGEGNSNTATGGDPTNHASPATVTNSTIIYSNNDRNRSRSQPRTSPSQSLSQSCSHAHCHSVETSVVDSQCANDHDDNDDDHLHTSLHSRSPSSQSSSPASFSPPHSTRSMPSRSSASVVSHSDESALSTPVSTPLSISTPSSMTGLRGRQRARAATDESLSLSDDDDEQSSCLIKPSRLNHHHHHSHSHHRRIHSDSLDLDGELINDDPLRKQLHQQQSESLTYSIFGTHNHSSNLVANNNHQSSVTVPTSHLVMAASLPSSPLPSRLQSLPASSLSAAPTYSSLHHQIVQVSRMMGPNSQDSQARRQVLQRVSQVIFDEWESVEVHVIGSCATDLFLPDSDIDLVVRNPQSQPSLTLSDLHTLGRSLQNISASLQIISTASVPLIKLIDRETGFTVDITLNVDTGLYSTSLVLKYLDSYPVLRPLTIVLKQFLKARGLNDLYTGGLPSYTLILMIVSFLQFHHRQCADNDREENVSEQEIREALKNNMTEALDFVSNTSVSSVLQRGNPARHASHASHYPDLGHYLLAFLDLYGNSFPYNHVGISLKSDGGYFPKRGRQWLHAHNPQLLCLENPLDPAIDLGFKVFRIQEIKASFVQAFALLSGNTDIGSVTESQSLNSTEAILAAAGIDRSEVERGDGATTPSSNASVSRPTTPMSAIMSAAQAQHGMPSPFAGPVPMPPAVTTTAPSGSRSILTPSPPLTGAPYHSSLPHTQSHGHGHGSVPSSPHQSAAMQLPRQHDTSRHSSAGSMSPNAANAEAMSRSNNVTPIPIQFDGNYHNQGHSNGTTPYSHTHPHPHHPLQHHHHQPHGHNHAYIPQPAYAHPPHPSHPPAYARPPAGYYAHPHPPGPAYYTQTHPAYSNGAPVPLVFAYGPTPVYAPPPMHSNPNHRQGKYNKQGSRPYVYHPNNNHRQGGHATPTSGSPRAPGSHSGQYRREHRQSDTDLMHHRAASPAS